MPATGYALQIDVDRGFNARLQLAPHDDDAIASESAGVRVQFDLASAQRARGLAIDWADDERGRGLVIDNPNAPPKVRNLTPAQADEQARAGTLTIVDVRPAEERALASLAIDHATFDDGPTPSKRCRRTPRWPSSATTAGAARRPPNSSARWASPRCTTSPAASMPGPNSIRRFRATDPSEGGPRPALAQNPPPASSHACSSGVLLRPSAALRCGKRPKRTITSRCAFA